MSGSKSSHDVVGALNRAVSVSVSPPRGDETVDRGRRRHRARCCCLRRQLAGRARAGLGDAGGDTNGDDAVGDALVGAGFTSELGAGRSGLVADEVTVHGGADSSADDRAGRGDVVIAGPHGVAQGDRDAATVADAVALGLVRLRGWGHPHDDADRSLPLLPQRAHDRAV